MSHAYPLKGRICVRDATQTHVAIVTQLDGRSGTASQAKVVNRQPLAAVATRASNSQRNIDYGPVRTTVIVRLAGASG